VFQPAKSHKKYNSTKLSETKAAITQKIVYVQSIPNKPDKIKKIKENINKFHDKIITQKINFMTN